MINTNIWLTWAGCLTTDRHDDVMWCDRHVFYSDDVFYSVFLYCLQPKHNNSQKKNPHHIMENKLYSSHWPWQRWFCMCRLSSSGCEWWPHHSAPGNAAGSGHCGCKWPPCSTHSGRHACIEEIKSMQVIVANVCSSIVSSVCNYLPSCLLNLQHGNWASFKRLLWKSHINHSRRHDLHRLAPKLVLPSLVWK